MSTNYNTATLNPWDSTFNRVLIRTDKAFDKCPLISNVNNLVNLVTKVVLRIQVWRSRINPEGNNPFQNKNTYLAYLWEKPFGDCLLLCFPVIGNIIVANLNSKRKQNLIEDFGRFPGMRNFPSSVPVRWREDEDVLVAAGCSAIPLNSPLWNNASFVLRLLRGSNNQESAAQVNILWNASTTLKNDHNFMQEVVTINPSLTRFEGWQLRRPKELAKLNDDEFSIETIGSDVEMNADWEFMIQAIEKYGLDVITHPITSKEFALNLLRNIPARENTLEMRVMLLRRKVHYDVKEDPDFMDQLVKIDPGLEYYVQYYDTYLKGTNYHLHGLPRGIPAYGALI